MFPTILLTLMYTYKYEMKPIRKERSVWKLHRKLVLAFVALDLIAVIVIVIMYPLVLAPISLIIVNALKG